MSAEANPLLKGQFIPMNRAVFLDRDGVINALVYRPSQAIHDSPYSLTEFRLLPGVADAINQIHRLGMLAVVISNQPGVAKGRCDRELLQTLSDELRKRLAVEGAWLDGIYYCLHHPASIVEELKVECQCRKPKPGLLFRAAEELDIALAASYMIGDTDRDVGAAFAAGCTPILVKRGAGYAGKSFCLTARDLVHAAKEISTRESALDDGESAA